VKTLFEVMSAKRHEVLIDPVTWPTSNAACAFCVLSSLWLRLVYCAVLFILLNWMIVC